MTPRPKHAYITLNNNRFELVVSDAKLEPAGNRLLRGDSWPPSVTKLYSEAQTMDGVKQALQDANLFLSGEMVTTEAAQFGQAITKTRKRRT